MRNILGVECFTKNEIVRVSGFRAESMAFIYQQCINKHDLTLMIGGYISVIV